MKKKKNIPEISEETLNELAPNLSSLKKENPFDVPKDYFENLPQMIAAQCAAGNEEISISKKLKDWFSPKLYVPIALVISIIIVAVIILKTPDMKFGKNQHLAYSTIDNSAEFNYADSLIDNGEMDESTLLEILAGVDDTSKNIKGGNSIEQNIPELNNSTVIFSDSLNDIKITDDDIIQYLMDNEDNDEIIDY